MGLEWFGDRALAFVRNEAAKRLEAAGAKVAGRARDLCPVDTGYLKSTIGYTYNPATMTLVVHADASYAAFVEFGTSRQSAQPYLRPALEEMPRFLSMVTTTGLQFANTGDYSAGMTAAHGDSASFGLGDFS